LNMSTNPFATAASGAIFGAALTAAGVGAPSTIIRQMKLTDLHMLQVFVTATGSSALILKVLDQIGFIKNKARAPSNLGWLGTYDGNIIGGLMIGAGMALTGSCPGTVYVQVGTGVRSGPLALAGGILGGIIYTAVSKHLRTREAKELKVDTSLTLAEKTSLDPNLLLLAFEGLCALVVAIIAVYGSRSPRSLLNPVIGGLLMGGSQLTSVLLTRTTLGISGSYEQIGKWFWRITGVSKEGRPSSGSIIFAIGTVLGSWALGIAKPEILPVDSLTITPFRAIFGGVIMAFGSRLAGGCTSGHGISGMSTLGVSSIVSIISMFAGGIALAQLID